MKLIHFELNGAPVSAEIEPLTSLVKVLRDSFDLRGTKVGCGNGECGACTVMIDGRAMCSCIYPAIRANGRSVLTVEGLATNGELTALQKAFIDNGATQCGFCTSGMLMTAYAFLQHVRPRSRQDVTAALTGNICRCTGYTQIIDAVIEASGVELNAQAE